MGIPCKLADRVVVMDAGDTAEDAARDAVRGCEARAGAGAFENPGALLAGYFHFAVRPRLACVGA